MEYEAIIGLEIHVQLNSPTKMFCDCPNNPGDEPNRNTCPICLWMPGAIPKFSQNVLEKATMVCLALNCDIQETSAFDQKVYYYPDLPKGFQLSQHHKPLSKHGWLEIIGEDGAPKKIRIHHVHMEEDVAKLVHEIEGKTPISLVDFNRAGTPLTEIVTEPDMRSSHDAMEFLRALRTQVRYSGGSECSMDQGSMRVDANISIRRRGEERLSTKVEVKNMNSIRSVGDAISYEIERQTKCIMNGETITLHTRLWDPEKRITSAMRGKFAGPCVPDPSVPRIVITDEWLNEMRSRLPEMPNQKVKRFVSQYGLTHDEAGVMSSDRDVSEYFEEIVGKDIPARLASHWIATQLLPALKEHGQDITDTPVTPDRFSELLLMLTRDEINANSAKVLLQRLFTDKKSPEEIVEAEGFRQVSDAEELETIVERIIQDNPSAVKNYKKGAQKAVGFLMGQAMQATQGKANPRVVREIMMNKLG